MKIKVVRKQMRSRAYDISAKFQTISSGRDILEQCAVIPETVRKCIYSFCCAYISKCEHRTITFEQRELGIE